MKGVVMICAGVTMISSIVAVQSQFSGPFIAPAMHPSVGVVPANFHGPQVGPTLAPQFTVSLSFDMHDPNFPAMSAHGRLIYDADMHRYRMDYTSKADSLAPGLVMNFSRMAIDDNVSISITSGQCMNATGAFAQGAFSGLFGWLKFAQKIGEDVVEGRHCDLWRHSSTMMNRTMNMTVCVDGDEPVYMETSNFGVGPPQRTSFKSDLNRTVDRDLLQVPDVCKTVPKPCGNSTVAKQLIYVSHPRKNYNLSGQDIADLKGDAVFLCQDKGMWKLGGYELFSAFELTMLQEFGQYTNYPPPGNQGFGGDGFHVGRETPLGIGNHGGQCADDAEWWARLGQWFSLPPDGQCKGSKQQIGVDCTWRVERRIKTLEMACLFNDHQLEHICSQAHGDFNNATAILSNALASERIDQGGCPSVTAPQCSVHPACAHLVGDCCPHQDGVFLDCCSQSNSAVETLVV